MKYRIITTTAAPGAPNVFVIEADEYTVDSDSLTLNDDNAGSIASFAAGSWVAIERLPENEAVDFARDR